MFSGSDLATWGFDIAGVAAIVLLLVTGLPACCGLHAPGAATMLIFALAFPVGFVLVYMAAVIVSMV